MPFKKNLSLDAFIIAIFLSALDIGVVAPSLTVIAVDLGFPVRAVIWVIALHLAVFVLALPMMEAWGAKAGKRGWFFVSLFLYAAGSLIAGGSDTWLSLIAGRVVQAMAAGGIVPVLSAEMGRMTKWRSKGWRVAVHAVLSALLILTPFLSSTLTWYVNWRWLFWINIPAVLIVFAFSFRFRPGGRFRSPPYQIHGVFYFGVILLSAMVAISQLDPNRGWAALADPGFLPFAVVAGGLGIPMMMVESHSERPFFSRQLFTDGRLIILHAVTMLAGVTWSAVVLVPGWMAEIHQRPPGTGGIFLSLVACAAWLSLPLARRTSVVWGYQGVLAVGFFAMASAYFTLALVTDPVVLTVILTVLGFGLGFTLTAPVHELMFEVVSYRQVKNGVMVIGMFRAAGAAIGLIAIGLSFFGEAPLTGAADSVTGLPELWKPGYRMGMLTAAGAAVFGLILALLLPVPDPSPSPGEKA